MLRCDEYASPTQIHDFTAVVLFAVLENHRHLDRHPDSLTIRELLSNIARRNRRSRSVQLESSLSHQDLVERLELRPTFLVLGRQVSTAARFGVVNLSRGGIFIASEHLLDVGSVFAVYIPQVGNTSEEVLEIDSEVMWLTMRGIPEIELPRGMGVQFTKYPTKAQEKLDSFIVETIARKLSRLW